MAQLVEQLIRNQQVAGSSPATSSKKSKSTDLDFFIHCEGNGISSRLGAYLITEGVYHQPQAVFLFAMMIYNIPC